MQKSRLLSAKLFPFFSDLYVSDDVGYEKPDSRFFEEALKRSNLTSQDVLFIGDSLEADILGASHIGMMTCWYNPGHKKNRMNIKSDYTIDNLSQLKEII